MVDWVQGRSTRSLAPNTITGRAVGARAGGGVALGSGGATVVNVNVGVGDPVAIAKEIRRVLNRGGLRTGVAI